MKRMEYTFVSSEQDIAHSIDHSKHDDYELPEFVKQVPISTKKQEGQESITLEHTWKTANCESVRVKKITFRKGEEFGDLYRLAVRDGADSITFKHNNVVYVMRKTVREIAEALFNAYGKIKGALEAIVGYLRTVSGNDYVISRADDDSWSFDRRIAKKGIAYVDVDSLDRQHKGKLVEMITEKIADLHSNNLIMGRFTLNNVLISGKDMKFTDLRKLRVSRKKSFVIDEFKAVLQYLFTIGIAGREDVYAAVAYYAAKNEENCSQWYKERQGESSSDELDVVTRLEQEVYS